MKLVSQHSDRPLERWLNATVSNAPTGRRETELGRRTNERNKTRTKKSNNSNAVTLTIPP